ncbi:guanylate kinase [Blochmannia endosymbiont of Polyrhachis (Hedomyrma) turneri]|uniref:guanylate kinase n=1 Tax=Blochmannia endosymbiont of Polyrhachis (Hedomyrma) turneri TaxID=1505596 RepID=UPI00061A86EC|nr:guanylate kinase [Blochmannia endosymbiont of Polyrhachis (Hedomyrma) turneri]AKC60170.1 guanylate kinase [Blochmannia endosymbiont of Polyrhachis (Hedomyrma) turneri]
MKQGTLYIISAPSGTGKSTLIKKIIQKKSTLYNITHSISYTTRNIRPTETNGIHYHFITIKKFKKMISKNIFYEYAKIFGHYYGTSKKKIHPILQLGIDIILDINWQGAKQIKKKIPNVISIFLLPPSMQELKKRLYKRAEDSENNISKRIETAKNEIQHYKKYDYIIINDNENTALLHLQSIIISEKLRYIHQKPCLKQWHENLFNN